MAGPTLEGIARVLHPLRHPPAGDGWNRSELDDLLPEAFAAVRAAGRAELGEQAQPLVVFPNPAGAPFAQATAQEWSECEWLVLACGRYEGIDERVYEWAAERMEVRVLSLGDYVLNGGEVAVLAMTEAIVRLLPGVVGNAESLVEESHEDGLLEYPSYTKPAVWRGLETPPVLLSGNHAAIAAWRSAVSSAPMRTRTALRRASSP